MGGRGAKGKTIPRLPNYQRAVILNRKVKEYLLNPAKSGGKAALFNSLGYTMKNAECLKSDIRTGLKENKAVAYSKNRYGHTAYEVVMKLGVDKKASIITGWQIDKGDNVPRFITAYKSKGD